MIRQQSDRSKEKERDRNGRRPVADVDAGKLKGLETSPTQKDRRLCASPCDSPLHYMKRQRRNDPTYPNVPPSPRSTVSTSRKRTDDVSAPSQNPFTHGKHARRAPQQRGYNLSIGQDRALSRLPSLPLYLACVVLDELDLNAVSSQCRLID